MMLVITDPAMLKSHVNGHTKKGGVVVHAYERGGHQKLTAPQYGIGFGKPAHARKSRTDGMAACLAAAVIPAMPKRRHPNRKPTTQAKRTTVRRSASTRRTCRPIRRHGMMRTRWLRSFLVAPVRMR